MTLFIIKELAVSRLKKALTILLVESNSRERYYVQQMMDKTCLLHELYHVESTRELMDYLRRRGQYGDPRFSPRPDLILVDLDLPTKDGAEALRKIQADYRLRDIPIALFGRSQDQNAFRNHHRQYSFIPKPVTSVSLMNLITAIRSDI